MTLTIGDSTIGPRRRHSHGRGGGAAPTASFLTIPHCTARGRERQFQRVGQPAANGARSVLTTGTSATGRRRDNDTRLPHMTTRPQDLCRHACGDDDVGARAWRLQPSRCERLTDRRLHVLAIASDGTHTIQFNSSGSSASPGRTITSYFWDFGDGTSSTLASPSHPYAAAASYNVTLTVTDSAGKTGRVTKTVAVQ